MAELFQQFLTIIRALFPVALLVAITSAAARSHRVTVGVAAVEAAVDAALTYFGLVTAYLVLSPQPQSVSSVALTPGDDLLMALRAAPGDLLPWAELAGNGVLLLPLGFLAPLRVRSLDSVVKVMAAGLMTSCAIELVQYWMIAGRTSSIDDVILNSIGATAGGALSTTLIRLGTSPARHRLTRSRRVRWQRPVVPDPVVPAPRTPLTASQTVNWYRTGINSRDDTRSPVEVNDG